ncbi:MAG: hypothetical protein KOO60_07990 [Gemmatimonadales bacterium]|nr:hypothetical protein [Gemmatimonadales bacterium]
MASDSRLLRLGVTGLQPEWKSIEAESTVPESLAEGFPASQGQLESRFELQIPGFGGSGGPGAPRLPGLSSWVIVPVGTRPRIRVVDEKWNEVGNRPLMVDPVPVVFPGPGSQSGSVGEILVLPGQEIPVDAPVPTSAREAFASNRANPSLAGLVLGEEKWWRGRRIVSIRLNPVRVNKVAEAEAVLESGTWEILFVPEKGAGGDIPSLHAKKTSGRGDGRFASAFLNPGLLRSQSVEAARGSAGVSYQKLFSSSSVATGTLLAPEIRIPIRETRLTRVSHSMLSSEGLLPEGEIREDQIRLYQRRFLPRLTDNDPDELPYLELEVPIHMVGDGGLFSGDDYFFFYGLQLRDDDDFSADVGNGIEDIPGCGDPHEMNNDVNWYWLAISDPGGDSDWARMATTSFLAAEGSPLPRYRRTDHHENQVAFRANAPLVDMDRIYACSYKDSEVTLNLGPLWSPDPKGGEALLEVVIAGYNSATRNLRLDLEVAGQPTIILDYYSISTIDEEILTYPLNATAIDGADAHLLMRKETTGSMYAFLNYANLTYDARYRTSLNRLQFNTGLESGPRPVKVTGFTSGDIGLVEITDPRNPVLCELSPGNIVQDGATWTLSVMPEQVGGTREFYAAGNWQTTGIQDWVGFLSQLVQKPVDPRENSAGPDPDLVVITHSEFREPLERWVQHRIERSGGELAVHVVDVQDLFDYYSGGLRDPWAIKRFTEYAITSWGSWALMLVGDANENARELQVPSQARGYSTDWVPTHYHVQTSGIDEPELMATDKWFVTLEYGEDYPYDKFPIGISRPWEMFVGRFPCNSTTELNAMIDKIITVETPQAGQDWRRRGLFIADDAWSNGYGDNAFLYLDYRSTEEVFASSERDSLAYSWEFVSPVTMEVDTLFLANWLDSYGDVDPYETRDLNLYRERCKEEATPALLSALSRGGLIAHYQGHGNRYLLAAEEWLFDRKVNSRADVSLINNHEKPWVFFGMGCHISDWAASMYLTTDEQSLGEKFLIKPGAGASATVGSSGFEYIRANRMYGEFFFRRMMQYPPISTDGNDLPKASRSRWMLGELLWSTEADLLAMVGDESHVRPMISQYQLLGDPLMVLDAGEPEVTATQIGSSNLLISDRHSLVALDSGNVRVVEINARDEAGIDRLKFYDLASGTDLPAAWITETLPTGVVNHQEVNYRLELPLRPYRHSMVAEVYDTGAPLESDRHFELILDVEMEAEFTLEGAVLDTNLFRFEVGEPVHLGVSIISGAWLDPGMEMELTSEDLVISNVTFELGKSRELMVYFTASTNEDGHQTRAVNLIIDGYTTLLTIEGMDPMPPSLGVATVFNFPNPVQQGTEFVFKATQTALDGRIRIFSTSGRQVASLDISKADYQMHSRWCVPWDGRDAQGDRLGNGTYLYRVELEGPTGRLNSDMQRLVMMQ